MDTLGSYRVTRRRYSSSAAATPAPDLEAMPEPAQHDLQRGQEAEDVGRVVVAEVRDAQDLALQLALPAGDRGAELGLQAPSRSRPTPGPSGG